MTLRYGFHASPFGICFLATSEGGLCRLTFLSTPSRKAKAAAVKELARRWPGAEVIEDQGTTQALARRIFRRQESRTDQPVKILLQGTVFQKKVWNALLEIPTGTAWSYRDIAWRIGSPKATRAVGTAIGANPVALVVPCHRVIRHDGSIGGYRWGIGRKRRIQAWERSALN